jgi:cation-transporting P-type ATPase E
VTEARVPGLSAGEARARRARGLGNTVPPATGRTYRAILRENALTFINGVIFALALALVALGQWTEALLSVGVVSINIVVGLVQEVRAKRVLDRIALLTRPRATVVRDGVARAIDPAEIVRGDLLVAGAGDEIVVDGTIRAGRVDVDESLLTGESDPVTRSVGDRVLSGSFAVRGSARYEAIDVGDASYANRLVIGARAPRRVRTPLQRQVEVAVRVLLVVAGSFAVILVVSAALEGQPTVEIVRRAIVVVGLVPNGLFVAIAAAYALGAVRMAGKGVLVQQANAVESMSNVDVLCLDKTGTITTGDLRLETVRALDLDEPAARRLLGDLAATATDAGRTLAAIARQVTGTRRPVRDEVAFSSELRWSGVAFADEPSGLVLLGAPEVFTTQIEAARRAAVESCVAELTVDGLRVLLLARADGAGFARSARGQPSVPQAVVPLALVALRDELRPGVRDTLARFVEGGIALKLISGDHPETVRALAVRTGIASDGRVVLGTEIAAADDPEVRRLALGRSIFARVGPSEKARIVRALRAEGRYVAMVGDGVNDVQAMKAADLAIAINDGTQAARAVSDLVLLENSFDALPLAFREGQRVLSGMQGVLRLFMTRITYVALLIAATALVDVGFPFTPRQSALLTFFTVGAPALVLAATARPLPHVRERLIATLIRFVAPASWSLALVGLVLYVGYANATSVARAQAAVTLLTVLCGIALAMFAAPPTRAWTAVESSIAGWSSTALASVLLAALGWILVDPARLTFFDLGALDLLDGAIVIGASVAWTIALRSVWRRDLFERVLGLAVARA